MIEVEVRGKLTEADMTRLKERFLADGKLIESQEREMFLLRDYPGYSEDPVERDVDIRLRNTNGNCEIMMKHDRSGNNAARKEISLQLKDNNLNNAKQIVKAMGYTSGLRMWRAKDVYQYHDIEWSLVRAPKNIYYFEAEQVATTDSDIAKIRENLINEAQKMDLSVFNDQETSEFIAYLDQEVNVNVEF